MTVLTLIDPETTDARRAELLSTVKSRMGAVPNTTKAMANSPALLDTFLAMSQTLSRGVIDAPTRERIGIVIAQGNTCDYCLSAHSYVGAHVAKLSAEDIEAARHGENADPHIEAILTYASALNDGRGTVDEAVVRAVRAAGVTDEELAEIAGHVALNVLTNYFNKAAGVEIDFPLVTT
ncbi:carboxymuconolactone decarboxylase family protein [uncultured Arthrobacter sp.]|uniref:carboxymuconolactone decarboxylase family protein n=1 Tax=uncultured Arthrobacter sp. TaxID=114050 RepID=UPI0025F745F7|nr:carboxymuconolactone decarboxylase family protein [uncultured Arthrobacter sp.]